MQFEEMGNMSGKTLMLLPGTCCDWQGFAIAFGLMVWIGAYDTLFLDWVLFANMKMFRLEGTEHEPSADKASVSYVFPAVTLYRSVEHFYSGEALAVTRGLNQSQKV